VGLIVAGFSGCGDRETGPEQSEESPAIAEQPFAELTGPHQVGVKDLFFVDSDRDETFTSDPDDRRHLLVRVWYPALLLGGEEPARYVPDPAEFPGNETFEGLKHVRTRGYADAEIDRTQAPYPVLLFHPGGGWTRLSDTFWTEQLASHGYVVFAVDHPGFNQSVVFPDGYEFEPDQLGFPEETGDLLADARAFWGHLDDHHFPVWLQDSVAVLDFIEELQSDAMSDFFGSLDNGRIGALGWSFGGATAVQLTTLDERVKVAVDGDGQLFGDVAETGTKAPVLLLHSGEDPSAVGESASEEERALAPLMAQLMAEVESNNRLLVERSPEVWRVSIRDTTHGSFSDLVLADPAASDSAARAHEIIQSLSLAFFDRFLRDLPAPLLDNIEREIPETFDVSRPGAR
jgi:dienelactone hydrolase